MSDIQIETAWMSRETDKKILWVRLKEQQFIKKVHIRAATKKPEGLSVRDFCPGIALERKKKINEILKNKKTNQPDLRWRVEILNDDFSIFTRRSNEATGAWTQEGLETLGPLPPIQWESNKRSRETPGDSQGDGPPQPLGSVTPPSGVGGPAGLGGMMAASQRVVTDAPAAEAPGNAPGGALAGAHGAVAGGAGLGDELANTGGNTLASNSVPVLANLFENRK